MPLALRPNCECCHRDLPNGDPQARICSFECTFCADCVEHRLGGVCPHCGGDLVLRPTRPAALLGRYPPSDQRVTKPLAACSQSDRAEEVKPLRVRFAALRAAHPLPPTTGEAADKTFFAELSGDV